MMRIIAVAAALLTLSGGAAAAGPDANLEGEANFITWKQYFDDAVGGVATYDENPVHCVQVADRIADEAVRMVQTKHSQFRLSGERETPGRPPSTGLGAH